MLTRGHTGSIRASDRTRLGSLGIGGFCALALVSGLICISLFKLGLLDSPPEPAVLSAPGPKSSTQADAASVSGASSTEIPPTALLSAPGIARQNSFHPNGSSPVSTAGGNWT